MRLTLVSEDVMSRSQRLLGGPCLYGALCGDSNAHLTLNNGTLDISNESEYAGKLDPDKVETRWPERCHKRQL